MIEPRDAFARAAEALVDTPFKLHGRNPEIGIDCVGLVECALRQIGMPPPKSPSYRLRNGQYDFVPGFAALSGFQQVSGKQIRGDLVTVKPGPAQLHLLVALGSDGYVHAHAGLRRVVVMTGPLPWPMYHQFRLEQKD